MIDSQIFLWKLKIHLPFGGTHTVTSVVFSLAVDKVYDEIMYKCIKYVVHDLDLNRVTDSVRQLIQVTRGENRPTFMVNVLK